MNDDDLRDGLRSEFAEVRLGTPVKDVIARGHRLRRNRRLLPALGAGSAAVGASVALTLGLTAATAPSAGRLTLTDWSVKTDSHHTISVIIRDDHETSASMRRLSRALQVAGVPALVREVPPRACSRAPASFGVTTPLTTFRIHLSRLKHGSKVIFVVPVAGPRRPGHGKAPLRPHLTHRTMTRRPLLPAMFVIRSDGKCVPNWHVTRPARPAHSAHVPHLARQGHRG